MIRQSGVEPEIIEYLKQLPSRENLIELMTRMGISLVICFAKKGYAL